MSITETTDPLVRSGVPPKIPKPESLYCVKIEATGEDGSSLEGIYRLLSKSSLAHREKEKFTRRTQNGKIY